MKSYISIGKTIIAFFIVSFFMFACNSTGKEKEAGQSTVKPIVMQVEAQNDDAQLPEGELSKELVCMVNNAYMGKKQIPVAYENKTYYGCCEMCVDKIKNNKLVRHATDPLTGKEVDKASAFIALKPNSNDGSVLYFESEESFKKYKATLPVN